jgi:hypothetical protein
MTNSLNDFLNEKYNSAQNRLMQIAKSSAYKCLTQDLPILVAFTLCWSNMAQGIVCIGVIDGIATPLLAGFCGYTVAELFKDEKGRGGESILAEAVRFKLMGCGALVGAIFGAMKEVNWAQYVTNSTKDNSKSNTQVQGQVEGEPMILAL